MTAGPQPPAPTALRCSDAARDRADPLVGTAPRPRRWLLVEHPGPWPVDAVAGSGIDPDVLCRLQDAAAAAAARILLVRRPGAAPARPARAGGASAPTARAWFVTDSAPGGGIARGSWTQDGDLSAAAAALASPALASPALASPVLATSPGAAEPLLLVCAHGRHDTCCALRGRPVAAALARRWPDATWECSHVGGDRFAANVVVLPDGWYYGGLDADAAVPTVQAHLDGAVDPRFVRGMTTEPPVSQAAVVAAMRQGSPRPAGSVRSTAIRQVGVRRWEVDLHTGDPVTGTAAGSTGAADLTATVEASTAPAAELTCRALLPSAATRYTVVDLRAPGRAGGGRQDPV